MGLILILGVKFIRFMTLIIIVLSFIIKMTSIIIKKNQIKKNEKDFWFN